MTSEPIGDGHPRSGRPESEDVADPSRMLALLWGAAPEVRRGPKPKVTVPQIVAAGIAVAREGGLAQLSMRTVAKRLEVGAMTLYTHVPGKAELVELMIDATFGERTPVDRAASWQDRVRQHAHQTRRSYERDPWLLQTNLWRRPLGPHTLAAAEELLQALLDAGLAPNDVVASSDLLESFVLGMVSGTIADEEQTRRTGVTASQYWNDRTEFWERYFSFDDHPAMVRLWQAGAFDQDASHAFERQVERIISGVERIAGQAGAGAAAR